MGLPSNVALKWGGSSLISGMAMATWQAVERVPAAELEPVAALLWAAGLQLAVVLVLELQGVGGSPRQLLDQTPLLCWDCWGILGPWGFWKILSRWCWYPLALDPPLAGIESPAWGIYSAGDSMKGGWQEGQW